MSEDKIKLVDQWFKDNAEEYYDLYHHTEEEDGEDVYFVPSGAMEAFCDFLAENMTDLICIRGKIGNDGVWFSSADLEKAKYL